MKKHVGLSIRDTSLLLLLIGIFIALVSCSEMELAELAKIVPQMEGLSGEIPIGVVLTLTGPLSSIGIPQRNGLELALEEINKSQLGDAKIKFIIEDSRGTPEVAVEAFNKLIHQDKVVAILGPTYSSETKEAFPIAQQNKFLALSPSSAASGLSAIGDFVFRASLTVDVLVPNGVKITQEKLGYQKVAVIFDNADVFSQSGHELLKKALNDNGVEILTTETFETGDTDFSAQLTRIKNSNPDAIFISSLPVEAGEILIQGRQLGIDDAVPFIVILTFTQDEIQRAGAAAEGAITFTAWTSSAETPGNQAFVANYRAKYGTDPNVFAAQSYAAVYILAEAISDAQSIDSGAIRDAMANIDVPTVLGQFSFDQNGDGIYNPIILVVKNGKFEGFE